MMRCKQLFFIVLFFSLTACSPTPKLHDSQGNEINFADYRGKWLLINYWATWCKPCYQEMSALNAFYATHKNKDVVMFGVSYDHAAPEKLPELIKQINARFPTLTTDPARQLRIKDVSGLPTTFLFGPNGQLKQILLGEQTQQTLEKAMK